MRTLSMQTPLGQPVFGNPWPVEHDSDWWAEWWGGLTLNAILGDVDPNFIYELARMAGAFGLDILGREGATDGKE